MKPNIAVVGMGYWGTNLVRAFANLKVLHSICDTRGAESTAVGEGLEGIHFYTDYSEVLANPEIDAVVLSTPAATHFKMAYRALEAGKDVFVEKPFMHRSFLRKPLLAGVAALAQTRPLFVVLPSDGMP
jgi:predicted dehydrogenase